MSKVFAGFLAATLLVLAVGCSGSDDDALVESLAECVNVLADVVRDHIHDGGGGVVMPPGSGWAEDNGIKRLHFFQTHTPEHVIDEKCAPFLGVSVAEQPAP
jgi:hypothetical protein